MIRGVPLYACSLNYDRARQTLKHPILTVDAQCNAACMDSTGACYSLDGVSLTGGLNSTRFTPARPSLDGTTIVTVNQKLDRLLSVSATQSTQLTHATSAQESTQQELRKLTEEVSRLKEQLDAVRAAKTSGEMKKIPRAVSVSCYSLLAQL